MRPAAAAAGGAASSSPDSVAADFRQEAPSVLQPPDAPAASAAASTAADGDDDFFGDENECSAAEAEAYEAKVRKAKAKAERLIEDKPEWAEAFETLPELEKAFSLHLCASAIAKAAGLSSNLYLNKILFSERPSYHEATIAGLATLRRHRCPRVPAH